jgi:hypothetical protein
MKIGRGYRYRVQWKDEVNGYRWEDEWVRGSSLRKDGLGSACDIVDHWKRTTIPTFYQFCSENGHVHAIGASPEGTCAFYAVMIAVHLLGNCNCYTDEAVSSFKKLCAVRGRPIRPERVTYGELRLFMKYVNKSLCTDAQEIRMKVLDKNLVHGANGNKARQALRTTVLTDGYYICAAFSSLRITHSFVLSVSGVSRCVFDYNNHGTPLEEFDVGWIVGLMFIRKVTLC